MERSLTHFFPTPICTAITNGKHKLLTTGVVLSVPSSLLYVKIGQTTMCFMLPSPGANTKGIKIRSTPLVYVYIFGFLLLQIRALAKSTGLVPIQQDSADQERKESHKPLGKKHLLVSHNRFQRKTDRCNPMHTYLRVSPIQQYLPLRKHTDS